MSLVFSAACRRPRHIRQNLTSRVNSKSRTLTPKLMFTLEGCNESDTTPALQQQATTSYAIVADERREVRRAQFVERVEEARAIEGVDGRVAAAREQTHLQQRRHHRVLVRACSSSKSDGGTQ